MRFGHKSARAGGGLGHLPEEGHAEIEVLPLIHGRATVPQTKPLVTPSTHMALRRSLFQLSTVSSKQASAVMYHCAFSPRHGQTM